MWPFLYKLKSLISSEQSYKLLKYVLQSLSPALLDIRKMCHQLSDTGLFHIETKHTYTLEEFQETQFQQLQEVRRQFMQIKGPTCLQCKHCAYLMHAFLRLLTNSRPPFVSYCQILNDLKKFANLVKEVTVSACRNYLAEQMQSSNTGACTTTIPRHWSVHTQNVILHVLMVCFCLSQAIKGKATFFSRSKRHFTPAASSGRSCKVTVHTTHWFSPAGVAWYNTTEFCCLRVKVYDIV